MNKKLASKLESLGYCIQEGHRLAFQDLTYQPKIRSYDGSLEHKAFFLVERACVRCGHVHTIRVSEDTSPAKFAILLAAQDILQAEPINRRTHDDR